MIRSSATAGLQPELHELPALKRRYLARGLGEPGALELGAALMSARTEIVRHALDALNAGDVEALVAVCDADFRLDMSDRVLNPSVYEGHDGIRAFYAEVLDIWERFTWEPVEVYEFGDVVVAVLHARGKGRGSGLELDRHCAMLWRVGQGRALSLTFYRDPDAARATAQDQPDGEQDASTNR